jgi:hypothetical protein
MRLIVVCAGVLIAKRSSDFVDTSTEIGGNATIH